MSYWLSDSWVQHFLETFPAFTEREILLQGSIKYLRHSRHLLPTLRTLRVIPPPFHVHSWFDAYLATRTYLDVLFSLLVTGCCEHGNEHLGSLNTGRFISEQRPVIFVALLNRSNCLRLLVPAVFVQTCVTIQCFHRSCYMFIPYYPSLFKQCNSKLRKW